ncbi:MAG: hypothetical protein OHK0038_23780 [Flammeovirgaceae bacterium]
MGLGWSLNVGGAIIRTQRGLMDELEGNYMFGTKPGFYDQYARLNQTDWTTTTRLKEYAQNQRQGYGEVMADEFYFSFLGYSGKFYFNELGKWTVISDQNIIVKNVEFAYINNTSGNMIRSSIKSKMPANLPSYSKRYFHSFTLVTPDGFQYIFGGKDITSDANKSDANEYSTRYRYQGNSYLVPTTFNLVKIISPKGYNVTFHYEESELICSISHDYYFINHSYNEKLGSGIWRFLWLGAEIDCSSSSSGRSKPDGSLIFPVYLKNITTGTNNIRVDFGRSVSNELRYSDNYLLLDNIQSYVYFNTSSDLKWYKLDNMRVFNPQNIAGSEDRTFKFNYTENSERLKLNSLEEYISNTITKPAYQFVYNPNKLPDYEGDNEDHWGYYNGSYSVTTPDTYFALREPDLTGNKQKSEILEKIIFPTGGYSTFEYEPHRYLRYINENRDLSVVFENKQTCGLRIKKINSYDGNNSLMFSKQYYYLQGYRTNVDINTLSNSGILAYIPKYFFDDYRGKSEAGGDLIYDFFSTNNLIPASPVTEGSHIGYSEIAEVSLNGAGVTNGYVIHKYSNFDTDAFNCIDEDPLSSISGDRTPYFPYSSNITSRGKKISESVYSSDNKLLKQINYIYQKSTTNFLRSVDVDVLTFCDNRGSFFGTAYKRYLYRYNLISKEVIEYDTNTTNFKKVTNSYTYNTNNFLEEESTNDSQGNIYKVKYKYPLNYTLATQGTIRTGTIDAMVMRNMLNYPIEKTTLLNNKVISSEITTFTCKNCTSTTDPDFPTSTYLSGGMVLPYQNYKLETTTPLSNFVYATYSSATGNFTLDTRMKLAQTFEAYDNLGNLTQYKATQNGSLSFIYDYSPLVPVAKVENAILSDVAYTSFENSNLGNWFYSEPLTDNSDLRPWGGKTGNYCFKFPNTTVKISKTNLNTSKWYKVSFWAKGNGTSGGTISINNTNSEIIPSSSTWVYVEKIITGVSTIEIKSNSTAISIDELRLCPLDAQMTTYTYTPHVGITTMCSPEGIITYYQFDYLNRLKAIKDQEGNLLKVFEYKYSTN